MTPRGEKKAPRAAWKAGQSGKPGDRPKVVADIQHLAREHGPKAIERLVTLMDSKMMVWHFELLKLCYIEATVAPHER